MRANRNLCCCWTIAIAMVAAVGATGCHLRLDEGPPGTIGQQRQRAVVHDPFPSNDLGPEIMGGRPLGFERPAPETRSVQADNPWSPLSRQGGRSYAPTGF